MIIKLKDEINSALDFNQSATELFDKINNLSDEEFILDFEDVVFISMSFAQAYYASKKRSPKKVTEINLSDDVNPMMEMIEKQLMF
ncbi:MAG: hypothetical protein ILA26_01685 [Methanobrevibacter sp.]|uniref:hypothetical protein n=1 Tax=Methanobrevibacter sp. TaxID=66852 RepID=UPI001B54201B|nr:hypothetical protein [Methanobrevibacter sp.]MBP3790720.1 hypothetical protein [Methanobrevibacter sp.]